MARGRQWRRVVALGCVVALTAGCERGGGEDEAVADEPEEAESAALDPALAASLPQGVGFAEVEEGQRLFATCATCHGFDGGGTQLGPSLRDGVHLHTDGSLEGITEVIRSGVADPEEFEIPMPAMGGGDYTAEELRALAAYVYLLGEPAPPS